MKTLRGFSSSSDSRYNTVLLYKIIIIIIMWSIVIFPTDLQIRPTHSFRERISFVSWGLPVFHLCITGRNYFKICPPYVVYMLLINCGQQFPTDYSLWGIPCLSLFFPGATNNFVVKDISRLAGLLYLEIKHLTRPAPTKYPNICEKS